MKEREEQYWEEQNQERLNGEEINREELYREAEKRVDRRREEILDISRQIFERPEPAFCEYFAADLLQRFVEGNGFFAVRGEGELKTAIRAESPEEMQSQKRLNIGFISEYDALPNGHACGHNLIAASGVAAAVVFNELAKEFHLPAASIFLGTPAEEGGGGKIKMLDAGFFHDVDYAMMIHPADRTMVEDWSLAGQQVTIHYHGKSAHCAASPWLGANALEAALQTINLVNGWRCQFKDYSRVHGIVTEGGTATNVIPEYAQVRFNVRSDQAGYQKELMEIVLRCARCAAEAYGVNIEIEKTFLYDPIKNDKVLETYMAGSFKRLGEEVKPRMRTHGIGSTDMGNVSQRLPAIHGHLKLVEENTHTDAFRDAAGGPLGENYVMIAAKAMVMTAIGLATDHTLFDT